ncbi:MAG: hypothetical protein WCQ97_01640 [Aminobacterium sp.]|uniref:hypothetical protein n=1 Tax=unclassified Aminobacterium TaxID=2685012 RepID=UPI001BCEA08C|nr:MULTISPECIES: hypothetical protein [unclassified Aminobacterium]MDD2206260.1 hypothetical protein [Aminobacterium sp.]MDD3425793.1 hypothetical protein [Aminobacterium sp.]MDD3707545.1 hypothetical protein [Aminobacterium sp.]MDD4229297.1 hypothetical protein [Aminobacterium sp.]MDD4552199.1 hypothetical protein [Aminobacterium sp.]
MKNKLSLALLFVMAVVLSAVIAVSFMTTEPDARSAYFWITFFFLLVGIVISFLFGLLQIRIDLDKGLPTPAFFGLGTLIILYDLFLIVNPLLFWKGFEFSVTGYAVTHIIGLAAFLSLSGTTLMSAVSITAREKEEKEDIYTIRLWTDRLNRVLTQARDNELSDDVLLEIQKLVGKIRYTDPVSCQDALPIEKKISEMIEKISDGIDLFTVEEQGSSEEEKILENLKQLMEYVTDREELIARMK